MAIFKCKMCGGNLDVQEGNTVCDCEYCGTKQTVPTADNDKKINAFNRANHLRSICDFDKAAGVYESIVTDFSEEAEAYWGLCLCKFGIEYVDDPATGKKIPTCHRTSYESIFDDSNFEQALEWADSVAHSVYRSEAKEIDRLQREILNIAKNEQPFDVFICYKESDENGQRTIDSELAHDIYDVLTEKGYKVFYARITLKAKLGQDYEPYIFSALNSAKVMLAVGTKYEYYNSVWVKNEWSRYLALLGKDSGKTLIPCYRDIDAYDMPKEFKHLQAQDLSSPRAFQDLMNNIEEIIPLQATFPENVAVQRMSSITPSVDPLLRRTLLFLEDGDWKNANDCCEKILDVEPECARAYLLKLCIEMKTRSPDDLAKLTSPIDENNINYQRIIRFGDEELKNNLKNYNKIIRSTEIYNKAIELIKNAKTEQEYQDAGNMLRSISGYKDSDKLANQCNTYWLDIIYNKAVGLMDKAQTGQECQTAEEMLRSISGYKDSDKLADQCAVYRLEIIYNKAVGLINAAQTEQECREAEEMLRSISGYKDSDNLANQCCTSILQQLRRQAQQKAKEAEEEKERRLETLRQQSLYQARESRRWNGLCQHCGGSFKKGLCKKCGRPKDY